MFIATRNDLRARLLPGGPSGSFDTGRVLLPVSRICRCRWMVWNGSGGGQVCYVYENRRRILILRRNSLWGSAMPTLLVAAADDASSASERRQNETSRSSWLHPVSSRDQDAVRPFAGPVCQYGVRRYHSPTPRMFRSRVRPSPAGEDRRQCCSILRTPDPRRYKRLRPHRSVQALIRQTIFLLVPQDQPCSLAMRSKFAEPIAV